jgi:hypothetical protein
MIGLIKFISNGCPPSLWRTNKVKAERIILNFYFLILNSKLKIQNSQLNQLWGGGKKAPYGFIYR